MELSIITQCSTKSMERCAYLKLGQSTHLILFHIPKSPLKFIQIKEISHFLSCCPLCANDLHKVRTSQVERCDPNTDTFCKLSDNRKNIWENTSKCNLYILINILESILPRLYFLGHVSVVHPSLVYPNSFSTRQMTM